MTKRLNYRVTLVETLRSHDPDGYRASKALSRTGVGVQDGVLGVDKVLPLRDIPSPARVAGDFMAGSLLEQPHIDGCVVVQRTVHGVLGRYGLITRIQLRPDASVLTVGYVRSLHDRSVVEHVEGTTVSPAEATLSNVFSPEQMEIIRWVIGNGLVDPVAKPRVLYLYGSGGEGKTTTINTLISNLRGTVHTMSQDYIGGSKLIPPPEIKACMVSRFVTYGDVVIEKNKINKSNWKLLTGNDSVKVDSGSGQLSCTTLLASNHLWYGSGSYQKSWFMHRTIPLVMRVPARGCPPPATSFNSADITCFVNNCVFTRIKYREDPPIGVDTTLICIFGYRVGVATRGIELDPDASDFECLVGTWSISVAGGVAYDNLVTLVSSSSSKLVREYSGTRVIVGVKPKHCEYKGDKVYELVDD